MRVKLTTSGIAALERPSGKDRAFAWDSGLAGFGVIAFASGKKAYIAQYREDGRSRRVTIGDVATMTLVEARSKARTLLAGARKKTRRRRAHKLEIEQPRAARHGPRGARVPPPAQKAAREPRQMDG